MSAPKPLFLLVLRFLIIKLFNFTLLTFNLKHNYVIRKAEFMKMIRQRKQEHFNEILNL